MSHAAVAAHALGDAAPIEAVLADWRTAPISPRLRGALVFLDKLTRTPAEVGSADVFAARAAGVSDSALRETIYVCFMLSTMDRLADAFDFPVPDAKRRKRNARIAKMFGYRSMSA